MGYISKNLMTGENIVYQAKVHWFIFAPSLFMLLFGIILLNFGSSSDTNVPADDVSEIVVAAQFSLFAGILFILLFPFAFLGALIAKISTELGVTTKRVIAKTGFIKRSTVELNHSKVEGFKIEQGILGRIFGFGTVAITGTGGGMTPIKNIDDPLKFRSQAMAIVDQQSNAA